MALDFVGGGADGEEDVDVDDEHGEEDVHRPGGKACAVGADMSDMGRDRG